ncbi:MAG: magnesium transporter CorA family protein [Bacteroidetes bacterium]|nr:magnesium transporter CorA family protein [Bacteroidota bacterium]
MFLYFKIDNGKLSQIDDASNANWIHITPPFVAKDLEQFALENNIPNSHFTDCMDLYEQSRYEIGKELKQIIINTPIYNNEVDVDDEADYLTIPVGIIQTKDKLFTFSAINNPMMDWCTKNILEKELEFTLDTVVLYIFKRTVFYFIFYLREINVQISKIEKNLKHSSSNDGLNKLLKIQKSLIYFLNDLRADELILEKHKETLSTQDNSLKNNKIIRDVMIEYSQAIDMSNVYSSILGNMMSAFGSIISNNLAYVVNRLTGVTIVLMIPTLIAGIYGMNIPLPFQEHPFAFSIVIIITAVVTGISLYYFRHKKWL